MAAGLDEAAFALSRPGSRPLNLGLGATSPVEHWLLYRQQEKHRGAYVYYGFIDTQLTELPEGGWSSLVGNRAMSYYVDPDVAVGLYGEGAPLRMFAFHLVAWMPVLRERYAIWGNVEVMRRSLEELGMPPKKTSKFGRADDFSLLTGDAQAFADRCATAVQEKHPLSRPVLSIVLSARVRGSRVAFVEMPLPSDHRKRFNSRPEWAAYRGHVVELVQEAGGLYVDASDWIPDEGFADPLHLSASGACEFSARLALAMEY